MRLKLLLIFVLMILTGCRDKFENKLLEENSVWLYSIKDAINNNNEKTMKLQFYNNGIADEVDTNFINYKWGYSNTNKTFTINNQEFKIVGMNDKTFFLKHIKTGLEARLTKIK